MLVESWLVGEVVCCFCICYVIEVLLLVLEVFNYLVIGEGVLFGLCLVMNCDGYFGELGLSWLCLYLVGECYISQMFYLCLLCNLESI